MNQRIQELQHQAISSVLNGNDPDGDVEQMYIPAEFTKKLAELIVKETMQVVANQLPSNQYLDVAHAVIEHFGAEE